MERLKKTRSFKVRHPPATRHRHPTSKHLSRLFGNCPPVELECLQCTVAQCWVQSGRCQQGSGQHAGASCSLGGVCFSKGGWLSGAHVSPRLVWFCPRCIWHRLSSRVRTQMSGPGCRTACEGHPGQQARSCSACCWARRHECACQTPHGPS